jgi:hypothetical protein
MLLLPSSDTRFAPYGAPLSSDPLSIGETIVKEVIKEFEEYVCVEVIIRVHPRQTPNAFSYIF